jgi:hypothetical protein
MKIEESENLVDIINSEPSIISNKKSSNVISSNFPIKSKHYLCPLCHTFPKLILKGKTKVYVYCKEIKGLEIDIKDYLKYNLLEGDINKLVSSVPNNKYIGYCFDCKKNISDNHSKEYKMHNIKYFEDIIDFIKNKLKIPDMNKELSNPGTFLYNETNKTDNTYILKNVKDSEMIKFEKKNYIDNLYSKNLFLELIQIIIDDSILYPNYIHYENIKNIFYYLSDQMVT